MQTISMSSSIAIRPAVAQARRAVVTRPVAAVAGRSQPVQRRSSTGAAADRWRRHAAPEDAEAAPSSSASSAGGSSAAEPQPETVFYEGSGSNAELAISLLLGVFVLTLPLTIASLGRRLWIRYKFTDRRLVVTTNSPILKREVEVDYRQIREIRSAPRAFGAWGDVVIFLKDGARLELAGLERFDELVNYMESRRDALRA